MAKMGSLRRLVKDVGVILDNAAVTKDWDKVRQVVALMYVIQATMKGGKRWSDVETQEGYLLAAFREKAQEIEISGCKIGTGDDRNEESAS